LWFEFLLDPTLLQRHLDDRYADPSAVELIILFLNNAATLSGTSVTLDDLLPIIVPTLTNSNGSPIILDTSNLPTASPEARLDSNSNGSNGSVNGTAANPNNKKCLGLKLLAVKVAAHLDFSLPIIERQLPINMQFMLLNELIKICEQNNGHKCSLFAYMNYYRWILRSVARLSYPSRKTQNVPIPLLQQIGK
jgi:integrator complex subunit 8